MSSEPIDGQVDDAPQPQPPPRRKPAPEATPDEDDQPARPMWRKWLNLQTLSLLVIGAWIAPSMCTTYIEPDQIGVRRSLNSGIEDEDFEQGHHIGLPLLHSWYRLKRSLHYVEFSGTNTLDLRTRENNVVHVDMAIV